MLRAMNSSLNKLLVERNETVDDICMKSLGEYIKSNKNIKEAWLRGTSISDAGIEILTPYLDGNTTFKLLYLNDNKGITDKSIPSLMKMIETSHIEKVAIEYTSITQNNVFALPLAFNQIKHGSNFFHLSGKELNDDDLIKICDEMKKYGIDKLKEIDLMNNRITSKGASVLFDTLKGCNSVVLKLNLFANHLDDECMNQLGIYLQCNKCVERVNISSNRIKDKGIEILSEYLIGNTKLNSIDLGFNRGITDASTPYLIEIAKRSYLTEILLSFALISNENKKDIYKVLSIPIDKREIPIKSDSKSAAKIQSTSAST